MKYSALPLHSHLKAHASETFSDVFLLKKNTLPVTFPCPSPMASAVSVDPRPTLNTAQPHDLGSGFWGSCSVVRSCAAEPHQDKKGMSRREVTFLRYGTLVAQALGRKSTTQKGVSPKTNKRQKKKHTTTEPECSNSATLSSRGWPFPSWGMSAWLPAVLAGVGWWWADECLA